MQHLNRDMLERYGIVPRTPSAIRIVQFGLGEALLGVVDRLIDGMEQAPGIACVAADGAKAALLREQGGLYTVLVRGYQGDAPVNEERVVQAVLCVPEVNEALVALAGDADIALALIDTASPSLEAELRLAAGFVAARQAKGLPGPDFVCLGDSRDCAARVREALTALDPDAGGWLSACGFHPALAEGFARRADAREAAKQCAEMNYADGMLHLAEPFARLTVQAPVQRAAEWGLVPTEDVAFTDDLSPALALKHRLFDGALFAMAAPGWLLGCDTLRDCMTHERLRAFVGHAVYDELLPADPARRDDVAAYAIQCFERFENPLNRSDLLDCAHPLLGRFVRGVLPLMRAYADEYFEPPRLLSFALAATIMLYAGARKNAGGVYEVARTGSVHLLADDPDALALFSTLSHDMDPASLAYAALADRELWNGQDLRAVDGLDARVTLDLARLQREPGYVPGD